VKKNDLIITIIFILFLIGPGVVYWFVGDLMDHTVYENRNLYPKPELTLKNLSHFANDYENYFNDHVAFKNEIRKIRSSILYQGFHTAADSRVIYGKNGWLFYNSSVSQDADSIDDYRNFSSYSRVELDEIKNNLENNRDQLNKKKIDFYILILPNKENVYSDYMPDMIKRNKDRKESKTELLLNYLEDSSDLNIVYPKQILVQSRREYDTYFKYDTHWNPYGAYLGVIDLMKKIDSEFVVPKGKISNGTGSGDLALMNLTDQLTDVFPVVDNFLEDIEYTCNSDMQLDECSSNGVYDQTILFVGDSFRTATIPYLAKLFHHSIFLHHSIYDSNVIDRYHPDIVVYEAVERYSNTLKSFSYLLREN